MSEITEKFKKADENNRLLSPLSRICNPTASNISIYNA